MSLATIRVSRFERKIKNILLDVLTNLEHSKDNESESTMLPNDQLELLWNVAVQGWSSRVNRCEAESMKDLIAAYRQRS